MSKRRSIYRAVSRQEWVEITPRDVAVFRLLAAEHGGYRYLTRYFIYALLPPDIRGGEYAFKARFTVLRHEGYLACPPQQLAHGGIMGRDAVYELSPKGAALIGATLRRYNGSYPHELMCNFIRALIELGVRADPSLRLISFSEMLAHPQCPEATRKLPMPQSIPLATGSITADGLPFGIERTMPDGAKHRIFFPGIEADCGSEAIQRFVSTGSSIYGKLVAYNEVLNRKLQFTHFGVHRLFIPIVTTSATRARNMLAKVKQAGNPEHFGVKFLPGFDGYTKLPRPTTDFLNEWSQADGKNCQLCPS